MLLSAHNGWFLISLSLIVVHELDAVHCHEWRILPLMEHLDDGTGMRWFIWLHVPLLLVIFWYSSAAMRAGGNTFSAAFMGFCILHAIVHLLYERHPRCEFRNWQSRMIIWSCAGAGLIGLSFHPFWY